MKAARLGTIAIMAALAAAPAFAEDWGAADESRIVYVERDGYYDRGGDEWRQARQARSEARAEDIDARQERMRGRIWNGWRSGELTRAEMRELMADQRAIEAKERHYLGDGRLSRWEYAELERDLDSASRRIYHAKHDADWRGRRD
jgi:hypothetical protein